jgi:hypothetical protein
MGGTNIKIKTRNKRSERKKRFFGANREKWKKCACVRWNPEIQQKYFEKEKS